MKLLESMENEAKTMPLYYMWINATCHVWFIAVILLEIFVTFIRCEPNVHPHSSFLSTLKR